MINVLDHGFIRLVDHMGSDLSIVRSARVSYNAEPRLDGSDEKLIGYLLKNKHTSPLECVKFTFEVKAPIFVIRQWHRHRTWAYNEVSARYTELPEEYYVPNLEHIGVQNANNKQMRDIGVGVKVEEIPLYIQHFRSDLQQHCTEAFQLYKEYISYGIPRELARGILPLNTYTRMFATVDLHNLLHFLDLRLHEHSQYEIRVYAEAILQLIKPIVPSVIKHQYGR